MRTRDLWISLCLILSVALSAVLIQAASNRPQPIALTAPSPTFRPAASPLAGTDTTLVLFFEDFESGASGWTYVDCTYVPATWHKDTYNALQGHSWWSGDTAIMGYRDTSLQYLETPSLNLSNAVNPRLTFKMRFSLQGIGGMFPPDYDGWDACNVWISTNNGFSWEILHLEQLYNCNSSYSFGKWFGFGPGIPGWLGCSGNYYGPDIWIDGSGSLPAVNQVKLRFAVCSDSAICTLTDSTLRGMYVDSVMVRDANTVYLSDNADDPPIPSELIPVSTSVGNLWHIATVTNPPPPSPPHVAYMGTDDNIYFNNTWCAIISPIIDLTNPTLDSTTGVVSADFQMAGSINVNDSTPSDYCRLQVKTESGSTWTTLGAPLYTVPANFEPFAILSGFGANLNSYIGQRIQARVIFKADNDGFTGSGIMIDNFTVQYKQGVIHDVGAKNMVVLMPSSAYFDTIFGRLDVYNYGLVGEANVISFWRVNQLQGGYATPWQPPIPAGWFQERNFYWRPTGEPGSYYFDAYTFMPSGLDTIHSNDTSTVGYVELTPDSIFELGYDNNQFSLGQSHEYLYDNLQHAYIRYTPDADRVTFNVNGQNLRARFADTGSIRIHIYQAGTDSLHPGQEVTQWNASVTEISPNWQTFDLSSVSFLQDMHSDFWVQYEMIDTSSAHLLGYNGLSREAGHFFTENGGNVQPWPYDLYARAIFQTAVSGIGNGGEEGTVPSIFALHQNYPNPFNPATMISFDLPAAAQTRLAVFDLSGRLVTVLVEGRLSAGRHQASFNGSNLASGIYLYKLTAGNFNSTGKMVLLK